jgi:hypothetical protein
MQEEVESKSITLAISTTKLTARVLKEAMKLISEALKEIVTFSEQDEEAFRKVVRDTLTAQRSTESKEQEKRLATCRSRMSELETMYGKEASNRKQ